MPPRRRHSPRSAPTEQHRVNHRIRVPQVRVVDENGEQLGVMDTRDAQRLAKERELDLVEVAARAAPPVCRIMDYGRYKYEQSKKTKQAKKHATKVETKEVKFRPKTDQHDFDFKLRHVRRFLEEGNKVRLLVQFRGREIVHPETGRAILDKVVKECMDLCHVEHIPLMEGRRMVMVISPKPGRAPRPAAKPDNAPSGQDKASPAGDGSSEAQK